MTFAGGTKRIRNRERWFAKRDVPAVARPGPARVREAHLGRAEMGDARYARTRAEPARATAEFVVQRERAVAVVAAIYDRRRTGKACPQSQTTCFAKVFRSVRDGHRPPLQLNVMNPVFRADLDNARHVRAARLLEF